MNYVSMRRCLVSATFGRAALDCAPPLIESVKRLTSGQWSLVLAVEDGLKGW